jgi:predicted acyl esterase
MKKFLMLSTFIVVSLLPTIGNTQNTRPQTPKGPFEYVIKEVVITNPKGGHTLAGTLTMPKKGKAFKAAIMVTGSGPQDRDETLMGHKPFAIIADDFAKQGIAILRVDDRGINKSRGNFEAATSADFASDITACFDFLKRQKKFLLKIHHNETKLYEHVVCWQKIRVAVAYECRVPVHL